MQAPERTPVAAPPNALRTGTPAPPAAPRALFGLPRAAMFALLAAGVVALFLWTVALGSVRIPLDDVWRAVWGAPVEPATFSTIVRQVRLPRALTALLAGAALGVGGLQMQTLFRNPLADPFILGTSAGASLGVALVVLAASAGGAAIGSGLSLAGTFGIAGGAALGAAAVTLLVLAVSRRVSSAATVLIIGLMVGYATQAVVTVLVSAGLQRMEGVRAYIAWGFGSFAGTTWSELEVFAPCVVAGLVLGVTLVKPLDALLLGDRYAASMGLHVRRVRLLVITSAAVLAGVVTAFCGPIAFIGIAAPHIARGLLHSGGHRLMVPASALVGAGIALAAGLIAQLPGAESSLPLNAVTSLFGAPVVVAILLRLRRTGEAVA